MNRVTRIILLGAVVIVAYDTMTALVSAGFGISYGLFSIGSFLIYFLFGLLTALKSRWLVGALAGAVIGFAEATVGWAISWAVGPGKPPVDMDAVAIIATIALVIPIGAFLGLLGGLFSLIGRRNAQH